MRGFAAGAREEGKPNGDDVEHHVSSLPKERGWLSWSKRGRKSPASITLLKSTNLLTNPQYEGDVVKRFMNLVALQPLVVDEAFMPHMKAMDVPFHTMYGSLICFKGLQSDRPKC